jgi:hypothetical protein
MAGKAFFLQRLNDHMRYLNNMNAALEGRSDFKGCDHTACKLGTWLHGEGRDEVANCGDEALALFDEIFAPHEAFHQAGAKALELKAGGDPAAANKAVTEMHQLSVKLVNILMDLDRKATDCK